MSMYLLTGNNINDKAIKVRKQMFSLYTQLHYAKHSIINMLKRSYLSNQEISKI